MAKLIAAREGYDDIEHRLEGETRIGRAPSCALSLPGDRLSREHLTILMQGEVWSVEDRASTNGTLHNGNPLSPGVWVALVTGDKIRIGEWEITFHDDPPPLPASEAETLPRSEAPTATFAVLSEQVIGRDPSCQIVLPYPNISRRHCRIMTTARGHELEDLGSRNGTFINGERLTERVLLRAGDEIRIGMALFLFHQGTLELYDQSKTVRLDAIGLRVTVHKNGQPLTLLQNIDCVIEPRQFVAVVGASGAGKSTLLNALTGFRKADSGKVLINGADYYANLELFRASIGYVPQDDIVHRELTVAEVLRYAAQLRLPPDTDRQEIDRLLDDALGELKLSHRKDASVSTLSGGERKRVNVGVELLTRPSLLFLDEPTSGLDPGLELEFIELVRQLTREGRTIVMITHATSSIAACDRLLFLARGGRIAYFGPPAEALTYFGVDNYADAYRKVNSDTHLPEEWEERFRASTAYETYVRTPQRSRPAHRKGETIHIAQKMGATAPRPSAPRQFGILLRRYAATLRGDRRNLLFLLAQAPAIGLLLMTVFPSDLFTKHLRNGHLAFVQKAPLLLFCIVISALLFGIVNACRELTKERPIYRRERLVNLRVWPYLASKVATLSALSAIQSAILLWLISMKIDFGVDTLAFMQMMGVVCLATWSGMLLGLLLSAVASSNDQAMSLVPLAVLPQIIFSGLIDLDALSSVSKIMPSYWAYAALGNLTGLKGKDVFSHAPPESCLFLSLISLTYLLVCYQCLKTRER